MLQRVALGQVRFNLPGLAVDARGVVGGKQLAVRFAAIDRLVSFLRVLSAEQSLDDLQPGLRIVIRARRGRDARGDRLLPAARQGSATSWRTRRAWPAGRRFTGHRQALRAVPRRARAARLRRRRALARRRAISSSTASSRRSPTGSRASCRSRSCCCGCRWSRRDRPRRRRRREGPLIRDARAAASARVLAGIPAPRPRAPVALRGGGGAVRERGAPAPSRRGIVVLAVPDRAGAAAHARPALAHAGPGALCCRSRTTSRSPSGTATPFTSRPAGELPRRSAAPVLAARRDRGGAGAGVRGRSRTSCASAARPAAVGRVEACSATRVGGRAGGAAGAGPTSPSRCGSSRAASPRRARWRRSSPGRGSPGCGASSTRCPPTALRAYRVGLARARRAPAAGGECSRGSRSARCSRRPRPTCWCRSGRGFGPAVSRELAGRAPRRDGRRAGRLPRAAAGRRCASRPRRSSRSSRALCWRRSSRTPRSWPRSAATADPPAPSPSRSRTSRSGPMPLWGLGGGAS